MIENSILRLRWICDNVPAKLLSLGESKLSASPAPGKWSGKQVMGHLIDSATNNHHRFVRGQFETLPRISYKQDEWNACSYYQEIHADKLIRFWEAYNRSEEHT